MIILIVYKIQVRDNWACRALWKAYLRGLAGSTCRCRLSSLRRIHVRKARQQSFQKHWKGRRSATDPFRKEALDRTRCRSARFCSDISFQSSRTPRQRNVQREKQRKPEIAGNPLWLL